MTPRVGLAGRTPAILALAAVLGVVALQPGWRAERMAAGLFRAQIPAHLFAEGPDAYFASPERFMRHDILFHTDDESIAQARRAPLAALLAPEALNALAALFGADATARYPPSFELASQLSQTYRHHYHHGAPFPANSLHSAWERCAQSDARCRDGLEQVRTLGLGAALLSQR